MGVGGVGLLCTPDTRLPKWSKTLKRKEGKMPPLGKLVMGSSWLSEALMAAASLARSPPKPRVELLPSQSAQLPGAVLELPPAPSGSASHPTATGQQLETSQQLL